MGRLREAIETKGLFNALDSDRGSYFFGKCQDRRHCWTEFILLRHCPPEGGELSGEKHRFEHTAMKEARRLRSAIRSLAESGATGSDVPNALLNEINRVLREARTYREVVRASIGFASSYHSEWNTPLQLLVPVAEAAADLLVHGDLRHIKKCENPVCILYIYDVTKNHSRRWCSMTTCGNRNKVTAFRQRSRATS